MADVGKLSVLLREVRGYLSLPENDYSWSSWRDNEHAVEEIDGCLARLREGVVPFGLSTIFAPTGPMQEVAESSGWGEAFLGFAERFEEAVR